VALLSQSNKERVLMDADLTASLSPTLEQVAFSLFLRSRFCSRRLLHRPSNRQTPLGLIWRRRGTVIDAIHKYRANAADLPRGNIEVLPGRFAGRAGVED
jgi:hypothetical protein